MSRNYMGHLALAAGFALVSSCAISPESDDFLDEKPDIIIEDDGVNAGEVADPAAESATESDNAANDEEVGASVTGSDGEYGALGADDDANGVYPGESSELAALPLETKAVETRAHQPTAASILSLSQGQPDIIIDNHDAIVQPPEVSFTGTWYDATAASEHFGVIGVFAQTGGGSDSYRFTPNFTGAGNYRVFVWNNCFSPRANNVPHTIVYDGGSTTIPVDQDCSTGSYGEWNELGTFPFAQGNSGYLEISDAGLVPGQYIGADGVRFLREGVIVVDNGDPETSSTGYWEPALAASEHFGTISEFAKISNGANPSTYRFAPTVAAAGQYEVSVWNSCFSPRDHAVPHEVVFDGGSVVIDVDQDCNTGTHGEWFVLGTYPFAAGSSGYIEISNNGLTGYDYVGADAVRLVPVSSCTLIESFETPWPNSNWAFRRSGGVGTRDSTLAQDGSFSLFDMAWYYNGNVTVGNAGDKLSWWVFTNGGRAYLGFDADPNRSRSFVVARNTGDIRFQDNPNYGFTELNIVRQSFTSQWYYAEVEFLGGGQVIGRVFDDDGTTLLNSVSQSYSDSSLVGGISMRSFSGNRVDSIQVCN